MRESAQILLNGKIIDVASGDSVAEVINGMAAMLPEGHVLHMIEINGIAWDPDFDSKLGNVPLDIVERLAITTQRPETAATDGLAELSPLADAAADLLREAARYFRLGDAEKASTGFVQAIEIVSDVTKFLPLYFDFAGQTGKSAPYEKYSEIIEVIEGAGMSIAEAQTNGDWNLLADVVEYEFAAAVSELAKLGLSLTSHPPSFIAATPAPRQQAIGANG